MKKTIKQSDDAGSDKNLWRIAANHQDRLYRFLLRRSDPQEVDDLSQEIYFRLLKATRDELIRNPVAYILKVALNVLSDFHRLAARQRDTICIDTETMQQASENPSCISPDSMATSIISSEFMATILAQLPPEQQAILLMFERDGYTYKEIASRLNLSERQVERCLLKARERLAQALRSEQGDSGSSTGEKQQL